MHSVENQSIDYPRLVCICAGEYKFIYKSLNWISRVINTARCMRDKADTEASNAGARSRDYR